MWALASYAPPTSRLVKLAHHQRMIGKLLSGHDLRRLAVAAECCEETARRFLLGQPVRSTSRVRLERAATLLGVVPASAPLGAGDFEAREGLR